MVLLGVDPDTVRAGWLPLFLVILIGVIVAFLYLSMRKQMRRIDVPVDNRRQFSEYANPLAEDADAPLEDDARTPRSGP